ncbi:MAG: hypothetical protein U0694_08200 [Anaerolineae bacterium]
MVEFTRWLIFLLLLAVIVVVIALLLTLILGILFAVLYLVPFGFWTDRYNTLLWTGLIAVPLGLVLIALLVAADRSLARRRKPHHPIGED